MVAKANDSSRAVVLLSGGLDSATVAAIARAEGWVLHALTVRYGQRHAIEVEKARVLAAHLEAAEHRLTQGGPAALARAREDVERATRLQGLTEEQRARTEALLADMVYHEGREILRQVERDLWQARRKLERARDLGAGRRIGDLDEWLEFVETETERFRPAMTGAREGEELPGEDAQPDAGPEPTRPAATEHAASDTFL